MSIFKLSHHYSSLSSFYGVKTDFDFHQLNLACAYIQLIRDELPDLQGVDDVVGEDNGSALLESIYNMEIIKEECNFNGEVDFYENWNEYCVVKLKSLALNMLEYAKPDVFKIVIMNMIDECHDSITRFNKDDLDNEDRDVWIPVIQQNIIRLSQIADGEAVCKSWGWQTLSGSSLNGRVFVKGNGEKDIPYKLSHYLGR
ncbi:hypothetical protein [Dickeya sp. NCPPB 3274]|uniref:hypothetical protein n=1 Tax=Dickeya sp. NCPPB 3274 TaxID=568766 RepID=UPI0005B40EA6|nr:hypothetical protein [Dickeya sp. NCPPB 3274]